MQPALTINIHKLHLHLPRQLAALETSRSPGSIRTAASTERFTHSHDGQVVTDHKTGLQWPTEESTERMDFDAAEKYCAALRLGGFVDWRLPELEELESIRDLTRHKPCIDTAFFESNSDWVWSRTPCAWSSGRAWIVAFYNGGMHGYRRGYHAFVRAVRRVSPAGQ